MGFETALDHISVQALIGLARSETKALGVLLERYRGFLLTDGQRHVSIGSLVGIDLQDVVQESFLKAVQAYCHFTGTTEPEFTAWLRAIHANLLCDILRKHDLAIPRCAAEHSFPCGDDSATLIWHVPPVDESTPSQRLIRAERALRLAELVQSLPEAQRDAVRLRHLEGWPLEKIAKELGRSVAATAGLIKRGLKTLRAEMLHKSWSSAN